MLNVIKYIFVIGNLLGLIFVGIALWRFKKTLKEHRKTSSDDFLSESEKIVQKKSTKILIIGFTIICITNLINLASLFVSR
jgi:2C-methyl-D-erythritol 2,4-cyclodiphosphate synthase